MKATKLFAFSLILVFAGTAMALDYVDIGIPASEAGHAMSSWGPIEPANSGGNYGGIDECRAIWSSSDLPAPSTSAFIDLNFAGGIEQVAFNHLEGLADDGFEVFMYPGRILVYTHSEVQTTELWFNSGFYTSAATIPGTHTLEFVATGPPWSGWATYGQVCFAEIWVGHNVIPADTETWGTVKSLYR